MGKTILELDLRVANQSWKQPTSDIDPQVTHALPSLQMNKKYTMVRNTVLIPCTKRKLPALVQVHFNTASTTTTVPVQSTRHQSHLLRKSLKILNTADNYTATREAHRVGNIRWAAIDSRASGNYFPSNYQGDNHNPLAPTVIVGCANDAAIKSIARDLI